MKELEVNVEFLDPLGDIVGFQTMVVEIMDNPDSMAIDRWFITIGDYRYQIDSNGKILHND